MDLVLQIGISQKGENHREILCWKSEQVVNFTNIYTQLFCQFPFAKKLQTHTVTTESCPKHFVVKN